MIQNCWGHKTDRFIWRKLWSLNIYSFILKILNIHNLKKKKNGIDKIC